MEETAGGGRRRSIPRNQTDHAIRREDEEKEKGSGKAGRYAPGSEGGRRGRRGES